MLFAAGASSPAVPAPPDQAREERAAGGESGRPLRFADWRREESIPMDQPEQPDSNLPRIPLERIELSCDAVTDGMIVADIETGRFLQVNAAICEMLGYSEAELLAMSVPDIHPGDERDRVGAAFRALITRPVGRAENIRCRRKDGRIITVDILSLLIRTAARGDCVAGFFRDVTARQNALAWLELQRDLGARLAAADNLPVACEHVLEAIVRLEAIDCGGVYLFDESDGGLELVAHRGLSPEFVAAVSRYPADAPEAQSVRAGEHLFIQWSDWHPHTHEVLRREGLQSLATVPFRHEGAVVGTLNLASHTHVEIPTPSRHAAEAIAAMFGAVVARLLADRAEAESRQNLQALIEHLPDLVLLLDARGVTRFANRDPQGGDPTALIAQRPWHRVAPESRRAARRALRRALTTGRPQSLQTRDIFGRWWVNRLVPLIGPGGRTDRAILIATDITRQKQAADAVKKERRLLRQLLDLNERDRQMTAYEIHDGLAQQLAGALFELEAAGRLWREDPARAESAQQRAAEALRRSIDEARRVISGLRPPILDEQGIVAALEYLVCEHRQKGVEIDFQPAVSFERLAAPLETAIFRIVQESLTNAVRHSRSDRVRVELVEHHDHVHLSVRDWGVGFDPQKADPKRFGLRGIRERVRLLGGHVLITTAPGKGTHIDAQLPLIPPAGETA